MCKAFFALLTATMDLRKSLAYGDGCLLTKEKTMMSFSNP